MRFTSLSAFHGWLPGRLLLPVGFAALIAAGTYVVADGRGYERGLAEHTDNKDVARLIVPADEIEFDMPDAGSGKGDKLDSPGLVRAIQPDAVYRPAQATSHAAPAKVAATGKPEAARTASNLPTGVERFDHCDANCDTRDPMVVRTSYPIVAGSGAESSPVSLGAPVEAQAQDAGVFGLPSVGEMVDRTVSGTQGAYGAVRDSAVSVFDKVQQTVSGTIDLIR